MATDLWLLNGSPVPVLFHFSRGSWSFCSRKSSWTFLCSHYKPLKSYSEASEGHFNCSHSLPCTTSLGVHVVYWIIPSNSDWSSPKVLVVWKVTVKWHCRFLSVFSQWIPDPIFSVHEWKESYFLFSLRLQSENQAGFFLLLASLPAIKILQAEFYLSNDENTF